MHWAHVGLTGDYLWERPDEIAPGGERPLKDPRASSPRAVTPFTLRPRKRGLAHKPCRDPSISSRGTALQIGKVRSVHGRLLVAFGLLHWFEDRGALVLDKEHDKLGGPRVACIPAHDVNVVGTLVIGLSRRQRDLGRISKLHHN
jgi:hypothetical protein